MEIGEFVRTIHGVNGILTEIRKGGYYGDVAFIATADMRTFHCPVNDIIKEDKKRPKFDADAAEEYISNLYSEYKTLKNETFAKDNEGRTRSDFITSPEYQKYLGAEIALSKVLDYFAKFDF